MRARVVDAQLHFPCIKEYQYDEEQLYGYDDDTGIEQRASVEEELHEHDAREQECQDCR